LEPKFCSEKYTLVIDPQSNPGMVPLLGPHPTFGPHFDQLSAKNTPALTGVRAGARSVINGFFLGLSIGNVWENFSAVRLAFPPLKLFEHGPD
jgi:hypothetical protein